MWKNGTHSLLRRYDREVAEARCQGVFMTPWQTKFENAYAAGMEMYKLNAPGYVKKAVLQCLAISSRMELKAFVYGCWGLSPSGLELKLVEEPWPECPEGMKPVFLSGFDGELELDFEDSRGTRWCGGSCINMPRHTSGEPVMAYSLEFYGVPVMDERFSRAFRPLRLLFSRFPTLLQA